MTVAAAGLLWGSSRGFAEPKEWGDHAPLRLLESLPRSKHSLADGISQAAKGLKVDAEHNVLQELSGSPEGAVWKPETEVFKDVEHVSRASQQLTLMALSPFSLKEILAKAQNDHPGIPFSITPRLAGDRNPSFELQMTWGTDGDYLLRYDLLTGKEIPQANKQLPSKGRKSRNPPMRLLVVEDEAKIAKALKQGLEEEHYQVDLARTGEEGTGSTFRIRLAGLSRR